ncbi:MAG: FAD-dependent oxidoreductase [Candidatus Jorgensenbacteria bacterium]
MIYDLIIIGGGPAGVAAGVYAARKKIKVLLIAKEFGGQSLVSDNIENWIGSKKITGLELAEMLEGHLRAQESLEISEGEIVSKVGRLGAAGDGTGFRVTTGSGKVYETKTVFLAVGSRRRKLGVPGEDKFEGKGVVYCSTCDAPVFKGKAVAVVGAGNSALEAAVDLFPYADKIYLVHRSEVFRGDPVTQEEVTSNPKVQFILNAEIAEIVGENLVEKLKYKDKKTGEMKEIEVQGVFVEIGSVPNNEIVKDLVELDQYGQVVVNHKTQAASERGIWAAGDITDVLYKQNNISAGDAVKAVLNIYDYLKSLSRPAAKSAIGGDAAN